MNGVLAPFALDVNAPPPPLLVLLLVSFGVLGVPGTVGSVEEVSGSEEEVTAGEHSCDAPGPEP